MTNCKNCGATVTRIVCCYCGTKNVPPIRAEERRTMTSDMSTYRNLKNAVLIGDMNTVRGAINCEIRGDMNTVTGACPDTIVSGDMNTVRRA